VIYIFQIYFWLQRLVLIMRPSAHRSTFVLQTSRKPNCCARISADYVILVRFFILELSCKSFLHCMVTVRDVCLFCGQNRWHLHYYHIKTWNILPQIWEVDKCSYQCTCMLTYFRIIAFVENMWPTNSALFIYVSIHCIEIAK